MNTHAVETELSNALCGIRDRHGLKNVQLFRILFGVVTRFTPRLSGYDGRKFLVKKAKTRVSAFSKASDDILYLFNNNTLIEDD